MQNYVIDWSANIPRGRNKCSHIYNTHITNEILGVNVADEQPALLHMYTNLGCNSNFIYSDNRKSNTNIVGI